ncbi:hypothetical protein HNR46_001103 [Haloferula luteola]|uniref:Ig-like domain-containing protein n=1 Tax=Haloferula luteola TaxID=595692 RepID=A0A840VAP4_9BACT|nr:immunoglobulin domain-containing protein [Haloferula luteola]MBB5350869.1 hypothetical protein [Haloferula luteola]
MKAPILFLLGLVLHAQADTVSWNYDRYGTVNGDRIAGVEPVANWNNSWPDNPVTNLIDDSGEVTSLDLTVTSFNGWTVNNPQGNPGVDGDGTYNRELLNGYLNAGQAAWSPNPTFTSVQLTQIPYASYRIIVYFSSDVAGREGDVSDGTTTYSFNSLGPASVSGTDAVFAETTDGEGTYGTAANYAVFDGLTGSSQTITVQMRDDDEWGGIAGFQVVAHVGSLPEFGSQPENQAVAVDGVATFAAGVTADPAPTVQWQFSADGVSNWMDLDFETFTTLELFAVQPSDVGYYRLVATNENGTAESDAAYLDVYYAVPEFFEQPVDTYAVEGSTVELTGDAYTYGNPGYQWFKDGEAIPGETDVSLILTGVSSTDDGEYYLRVTDDVELGLFADSVVVEVRTFAAWDGLVSDDPFAGSAGYVTGELPVQEPVIEGYEGAWTDVDFGDAEPEVLEGSLVYADPYYLGSSGDRVGKVADAAGIDVTNSGRVFRELAPALRVGANTTGVRYLSWIYQNGNEGAADAPTVHSVLSLYRNTGGANPSGDAASRVFEAGISDVDFGMTHYGFRCNDLTIGDLGVELDAGVHLFVVKFDLSADFLGDKVTVWLDPDLGSGEPTGGTELVDLDLAFDSLAFSDYGSNSMAWDEVRWGSSFDSVTLNPNPPAGFAAWIAGYPGVGELDGPDDAADGDGLGNALENYFGTDPTVMDGGWSSVQASSAALAWVHPLNAMPAGDLEVAYEWSTDLNTWWESGASDGVRTVTLVRSDGSPTAGMTTVTASWSGVAPAGCFVRVVAQWVP